MTSRNYVFTLNNYTEDELAFWTTAAVSVPKIKYAVAGLEVGESGTPHLQGYLVLSNSLSKVAVHKLAPGCKRIHLETRRGTAEQARAYCLKGEQSHEEWRRDGVAGPNYGLNVDYLESGDWAACQQGARTDLEDAKAALRSGMNFQDFLEEFSGISSRCMRFFEKYYQGCQKDIAKQFRDVDVTVLYGAPGSGKTRAVFELFPSAFNVDCSVAFPFDGYDGEDVIVLNDFKGNLQRKTFLETLEGYPQKVNVKNGHTWARWTKVFITSNFAPWDWYREYTWAEGRRLHSVLKFEAPEIAEEVDSADEGVSDEQLKQFMDTLEHVPQELISHVDSRVASSPDVGPSADRASGSALTTDSLTVVAEPALVKVAEGNSETSASRLPKKTRARAMEKLIARLCEGTFASVRAMPNMVLRQVAEPSKFPGMRAIHTCAWAALPRVFGE